MPTSHMFVCALLTFLFPLALGAQTMTTALDFELQANLIIVRVSINGVQKDFILDTGASRTTLASSLIEELKIPVVEKSKARGVGGEVDASIAHIDSLQVGDIVLRDLSFGSTDFTDLGNMCGIDVSGVLGYDFLLRFKVTIDYKEKKLSLEQYEEEELARFVIQDDKFSSPEFRIDLKSPDTSWEFITETPLSQILVILKKVDKTAEVKVSVQELHGMKLDDLIPHLESAFPAQVADYKKLSADKKMISSNECYVVDYKGKKDGVEKQFRHFFFKTEKYLYGINCSSALGDFALADNDFDAIVRTIRFLE